MKNPKMPFPPNKPRKFYEIQEEISFAWEQELNFSKFLKLFPKGIKRKDIKLSVIRIGEDDKSEHYIKVSYVGRKPNPHYKNHLSQYKTNLIEYKKELKKYNLLMIKYNSKALELEIKNRKVELKEMESKLKKMRVKTT